MTLSSMLVSRDYQEISVLECILSGLHIDVEVEPEPERAWKKFSKSKVDALIVDSDLEGAGGLLRELQKQSIKNSVPLVIMSSSTDRSAADHKIASFRFEKPISVEQAVHVLSSARNEILDGRLRYHRQALEAPVLLMVGRHHIEAKILNLSQGGIGIYGELPKGLSGPVRLKFALPRKRHALEIEGEVAWANQQGRAGIRFVKAPESTHRELQIWLERQYFTY